MKSPARFLASQAAKRVILRAASVMREGELTAVLPGGKRRVFGTVGSTPAATLRIHDDEFFSRVLLHGEIGVGEAYVDGLWDSDDLVALMELGVENRRHVQFSSTWMSRASKVRNVRLHRGRRNTQEQAKDNIHAHYDLSNDLFRLFLDETMTYSSAYFSAPDQPLADAQRNKYRMLGERAGITKGDHVLEIGSGWGGFAMFAAERYGCRVTSITISDEQYALARERVEQAGLSDRVEIRFCDYRDIEGQFDKIVSIEMFEAVGAEYFEAFFQACDRALKPGGRMAMQTISLPDRAFISVRDGVNWVQKYIFPGGMLPSIAEIERSMHKTDLVIDGLEDIGAHYALTLRLWRERFMSRLPEVRALGFDTRFIRMWEYYLAVCEAGFLTRNTSDLQIGFSKLPVRAELPAAKAAAASDGVAAVEEAGRIVAS
jgi:cyclopropane-fatty-acyl-phospholipid synthase